MRLVFTGGFAVVLGLILAPKAPMKRHVEHPEDIKSSQEYSDKSQPEHYLPYYTSGTPCRGQYLTLAPKTR